VSAHHGHHGRRRRPHLQCEIKHSLFFRKESSLTNIPNQDAIDALNSLQTPYAVIEARRKAGIRPDATSVREMRGYLRRIGYTPSDLDRLHIVHVAGTKGKGSTCAFVDSILSRYRSEGGPPHKVGLFTSPHLIAVRERIRINSAPLSEEAFARYFFDVWDRLEANPEVASDDAPAGSKPIYARFLTLMSFHVFLSEGVDAAVYETGIGGEYDATNVIERPAAAGISTLGIDHVYVLGDTVDKIAWHKAGIMKPGCPAFTIEQVPEAAEVLARRATEKGVDLTVLPVDPRLSGVGIRPDATFQKRNASLAIALAEKALAALDPSTSTALTPQTAFAWRRAGLWVRRPSGQDRASSSSTSKVARRRLGFWTRSATRSNRGIHLALGSSVSSSARTSHTQRRDTRGVGRFVLLHCLFTWPG
jgi:hypothetical protein